jgi:Brp/Blh family beta-carotene 15,15'-monooxygenase
MKNKGLFFTKLSSIATVATVFALWLSVYFSENVEDILGYILILSVGILHGANDIKLIRNTFIKEKKLSFKLVLRNYILLVLITGLSFFVLPAFALLVFVLLSAFHFGEQHMVNKIHLSKNLSKFFCLLYGLVIFGLLFYLNAADTSMVIFDLTGFMLSQIVYGYALIISFSLLLITGIYMFLSKQLTISLGEELFLLVLFFIIFKIASLIWAFSIYFIFWHSLPSLKDQIGLLYGNFSTEKLRLYIKESFIYWIVAIIGLGLVLFIFRSDKSLFLSLFFAFLAAITLPHVFVMHKALK